MTHPELEGQEIFVRPKSVRVHEASGWKADAASTGKAPAKTTTDKSKG